MRVRALSRFVLLAVLALPALRVGAEESRSWTRTPLDLGALREDLQQAVRAREQLAKGDLAAAREILGADPETELDGWKTAVGERVAALTDLIAVVDERTNGKTLPTIEEELGRATDALDALRAEEKAGAREGAFAVTDTPVIVQAKLTAAEADAKKAQATLDSRNQKIQNLSNRVPTLDSEIKELKDRLDESPEAGADALASWRRDTDAVRLTADREWRDFAPEALGRWSRLVVLRQTELEIAADPRSRPVHPARLGPSKRAEPGAGEAARSERPRGFDRGRREGGERPDPGPRAHVSGPDREGRRGAGRGDDRAPEGDPAPHSHGGTGEPGPRDELAGPEGPLRAGPRRLLPHAEAPPLEQEARGALPGPARTEPRAGSDGHPVRVRRPSGPACRTICSS